MKYVFLQVDWMFSCLTKCRAHNHVGLIAVALGARCEAGSAGRGFHLVLKPSANSYVHKKQWFAQKEWIIINLEYGRMKIMIWAARK